MFPQTPNQPGRNAFLTNTLTSPNPMGKKMHQKINQDLLSGQIYLFSPMVIKLTPKASRIFAESTVPKTTTPKAQRSLIPRRQTNANPHPNATATI